MDDSQLCGRTSFSGGASDRRRDRMGESWRPCERNYCLGLPCLLDPFGGPCASVAATGAPKLGVVPASISFPLNFGKVADHHVNYPETGLGDQCRSPRSRLRDRNYFRIAHDRPRIICKHSRHSRLCQWFANEQREMTRFPDTGRYRGFACTASPFSR